jgi:cysteinyl-tRNA synthetase
LARAGSELARIDALHARLAEAPRPAGRDAGFDAKVKASEVEAAAALADDLNVSGATGALFRLIREANAALDRNELPAESAAALSEALGRLDAVFGVIAGKTPELLDPEIEALIASRQQARKAKNFQESDRIRDLLAAKGIVLEDTASGVRWRRVSAGASPR